MTQHEAIINKIINKINANTLQLASLPDILIKINKVLSNQTSKPNDIAKVIQTDSAMSSRLLQIANSPAMRGYNEIETISEAVVKLGVSFVKNLAICISIRDRFDSKHVQNSILTDMLRDNIFRSIYSFVIAKSVNKTLSADIALLAGLLSNLGHIVILRYIIENHKPDDITNADIKQIADEHGDQISKIIIAKWNMPAAISEAMFSANKEPNLETPTTYYDIIKLADYYIKHKQVLDDPLVKKVEAIIATASDDITTLSAVFR